MLFLDLFLFGDQAFCLEDQVGSEHSRHEQNICRVKESSHFVQVRVFSVYSFLSFQSFLPFSLTFSRKIAF